MVAHAARMRPLPLLALAKALALTLPLATAVSAQDEAPALVSGPAAGFPLHPISVYAERGPFAGQEFNAAEKVGDAPAAFLFIHDLSRNTAPVIRELDRLGKDHAVLGFEWFSIILNADRTEGENLLKCVNGSLRLHRPMILSLDGLEGPGDYALNRRCTLTRSRQGGESHGIHRAHGYRTGRLSQTARLGGERCRIHPGRRVYPARSD